MSLSKCLLKKLDDDNDEVFGEMLLLQE